MRFLFPFRWGCGVPVPYSPIPTETGAQLVALLEAARLDAVARRWQRVAA